MSSETKTCKGKFTILGMQNKCLICGGPLKIHLAQFNENPERVIKTPMIPEDEYMALGSDMLEDGITRVLVPLTAEDDEIRFIQEELEESDRTLESIAKVTEFFEGSESPAEALESAETEDLAELDEMIWGPEDGGVEPSDDQKAFREQFLKRLVAEREENA